MDLTWRQLDHLESAFSKSSEICGLIFFPADLRRLNFRRFKKIRGSFRNEQYWSRRWISLGVSAITLNLRFQNPLKSAGYYFSR
jgi:hypothetical protein